MRISDWSSDVCSSDLVMEVAKLTRAFAANQDRRRQASYFPFNPISRLRKFLLTGDIQPDPTEDRPLLFEPLLGGIVGHRNMANVHDLSIDRCQAISDVKRIFVARAIDSRSEERSVGKECVSRLRSRWSPFP